MAKAASIHKQRCIGILREVKNKWERRSPLVPDNVADLTRQGIKVLVQPSHRRIFTDDEFKKVCSCNCACRPCACGLSLCVLTGGRHHCRRHVPRKLHLWRQRVSPGEPD